MGFLFLRLYFDLSYVVLVSQLFENTRWFWTSVCRLPSTVILVAFNGSLYGSTLLLWCWFRFSATTTRQSWWIKSSRWLFYLKQTTGRSDCRSRHLVRAFSVENAIRPSWRTEDFSFDHETPPSDQTILNVPSQPNPMSTDNGPANISPWGF